MVGQRNLGPSVEGSSPSSPEKRDMVKKLKGRCAIAIITSFVLLAGIIPMPPVVMTSGFRVSVRETVERVEVRDVRVCNRAVAEQAKKPQYTGYCTWLPLDTLCAKQTACSTGK